MAKTPADFSNLWAWYKADAGVVGTTSVSNWEDQSGNSRILSSDAGHEPALVAAQINSLPVVSAYGKSAKMLTAANFPNSTTSGTIFFVGRQKLTSAVTSGDSGTAFIGAGSTVNMQLRRGDNAGSGWDSIRGGFNTDDTNSPETTVHIDENVFYTVRLRCNGTNNYLSINNGVEVSVPSSGGGFIATPLSIFKTLSAPYGNKELAEIVIYTDNKTGSDQTLVEYYLNQKYAHYSWSGGVPAGWVDPAAVITFPTLSAKNVGDANYAPGATSTNTVTPITYTSSNLSVATIVSGNIHIVGVGTSSITASQAAGNGYDAASDVIRTLTVNALIINTMATNAIQGDLVGLFISTNIDTPAWKEIVCGENVGLDGSRDVNSKKTKCGVIKGFGPASYTINGSGTHNTAPGSNQISANELMAAFQDETEILVKIAYATDDDLYYRQGQGQLTKYTESANTGDPLSFDFTIDVSGNIDITA